MAVISHTSLSAVCGNVCLYCISRSRGPEMGLIGSNHALIGWLGVDVISRL